MPTFRARPTSSTSDPVDARRIHIPVARAMVDCGIYVDGERLPGKYTHLAAVQKVRDIECSEHKTFVWIGLHEPDEHQMQSVAEVFGLHPLAVEDAVHAHQRPKLERYDDTLFLVLKTVNYVPHDSVAQAREIVETGEIMVFVGPDFVVTVRHGDHTGLAGVRHAMEADQKQMALGPYSVMHAIADHVVDSYRSVTALMECDIDTIEEDAFSTRNTDIAQIYMLKREVVEMRRAIAPLSVALQRLSDHKDLISKEILRYFRDVVDHQNQAADQINSYDEMLSSLVQAELAKVGMQQNTDMRKISAWVAIAAVPTAIAGIYGMNFEHMPELQWTWGYPTVLLVMFTVCSLLYRTFRRNHWL
ncbi:magnesium/cobalt transporter CorA [Mycolicibacterium murale]|jgi:magnesium transporter|uniref:magnesium/cobalt transporter CorA n=1 Tax=Mycolicibacterium murale TaxID=182220 RepID=UPI0018743A77|nr:magnesium/cobalt transporter CorA [Mycolicibacterium murale]MCV7184103.1 magnesium/cobalt transporter CorA [Mycolicibacterium murale]